MRLASLVYGQSPSRTVARALISGGRAASARPATLGTSPDVTGQPARATATSPVRVFVRPGDGSMTVAPADPHVVGGSWRVTSCECTCHFGSDACDPLPGALASYNTCDVVRR